MSTRRSLAHIVDKSNSLSLKKRYGILSFVDIGKMQANEEKEKEKEKESSPPPYVIDLKEASIVVCSADADKESERGRVDDRVEVPVYFNHPFLELLRKQSLDRIRSEYETLCASQLFLDLPPKDSFNRWLLERMILGGTSHPEFLIPSRVSPEVSPSMKRELLDNIPFRPNKVRNQRDAVNNLRQYVNKACLWFDKDTEKRELIKTIKGISNLYLESRNIFRFRTEEIIETFDQVKALCQEQIRSIATPLIENICVNMSKYSNEESLNLKKALFEMSQSQPSPITHLTSESPHNFEIQVNNFRDQVELVCKIDSKIDIQKINTTHFEKLKLLYKKHARSTIEETKQIEAVYCLLRRYQTFFGNAKFEGTSLQGALTPNAFKVLNELFGVTFECFASPLNCYFSDFCSAFPDTDSVFGSRGSFLSFQPLTGSFEANPPFTEELMNEMVNHMEKLLEATQQPLSFVIFLPEWNNPPFHALVCLQKSEFLRGDFVVDQGEHSYIGGDQHRLSQDEARYKAIHGTHVFFIQNESAFEKWTPTREKMDYLKREMV